MVTKKCYLLTGNEDYLKEQFIKDLRSRLLNDPKDIMNYVELTSKEIKTQQIIDLAETLPFMSEYKIIYIKDSGFIKPGSKEEAEKLEKWIGNIPDYCIIIFDEKEVDKRSKLYKKINKEHSVIEFNYPDENEAYKIVADRAKELKLNIDKNLLLYFTRNMPQNLSHIFFELDKLASFTAGKKVQKEDIDAVCVFGLEQRIFELVKQITLKNAKDVLRIYNTLIESKESPIAILVLISRQYRLMLQVKYMLKENIPDKQIASNLKLPVFALKDITAQAQQLTFKKIQSILEASLECDKEIKYGLIEAVKAVELLIIKCVSL